MRFLLLTKLLWDPGDISPFDVVTFSLAALFPGRLFVTPTTSSVLLRAGACSGATIWCRFARLWIPFWRQAQGVIRNDGAV